MLVNRCGEITEGTRTNFYTIRGKNVFTPPVKEVLQGVTYLTLGKVLLDSDYELVESQIELNFLASFDGVFLTSTSTKIVPIRQIDDFVYPEISPEIKHIMKLYKDF